MMEHLVCSITLSGKPSTLAGIHFLDLLGEDEMAFDNLFCVAFKLLDAQWLAKRASYMEFNVRNFYLPLYIFDYASQIIGIASLDIY